MSGLSIETINPFEYEAELKHLFVEHGVAHYPAFFDAAYPAAAALGSAHWVGFDAERRIVMHVARFAHRFALGDREVVGGLLVNLMVEKAHRTFFPVASMMRRVVADSARGGIDFLYTNPNVEGGAIIKAAGLKPAGTLQRFALPLGGNSWWGNIGVRMYATARRLMSSGRSMAAAEHKADGFNAERFAAPARRDVVTPFHPEGWFRIWLAGYPAPEDRWFTFGGSAGSPKAAVLVRGPEALDSCRVLSVWRSPDVPLASILWPIARVMGREGVKRVFIWTLAGSAFAAELTQMGFLARADAQPFFMKSFTPAGDQLIGTVPRWEITDFDCDR